MRLLLLIYTASPALANLVVPLFLIAPLAQRVGGAISFCLLIITLCLPLLAPSSNVLRLFRRFHMRSFACPSRRASSVFPLSDHAARDVIVPIAPLIVSPYGFSSPLAPSLDTIGGEGCLPLAVPFLSARRGIIPAFASHPDAHRFACLSHRPMPINTRGGASPSVVFDCGRGVGSRSYRLCYQSAHSLRQCSPRSSTR